MLFFKNEGTYWKIDSGSKKETIFSVDSENDSRIQRMEGKKKSAVSVNLGPSKFNEKKWQSNFCSLFSSFFFAENHHLI